jgi:hypothetical protein
MMGLLAVATAQGEGTSTALDSDRANPSQPRSPSSRDSAAVFVELRLFNALIGGRAKEWQREARVSFWLENNKASHARIGPKPGWSIAGWCGCVEKLSMKVEGGRLTGGITARISSNEVDPGEYDFVLSGENTDKSVRGTFTSQHNGKSFTNRSFSGVMRHGFLPQLDNQDVVYTLHIVEALPRKEPMTLYLDRQGGAFLAAFAFAPTYSRRPFEVDASGLQVEDDNLHGEVLVFRSRMAELQEGGAEGRSRYRVQARLETGTVLGTYSGTNPEGNAAKGPLWGHLEARPAVPSAAKVFLKLEDGFSGGAYWQNRVFFNFIAQNGRASTGKADNNKGIFSARFDGADLEFQGVRILGTVHATVLDSKSVHHGPYLFRLDGLNVGNVLSGRFTTLRDTEELKGGYFVGGLEAIQTTVEANR